MKFASLAEAVPILGPLLADAQFRWWLLGIYLAIGPVPEDIPSKDPAIPPVTKWRWGGLLRVFLIAAVSHSRLADRVGSLESAVEQMVIEFRLFREGFRGGTLPSGPDASSGAVASAPVSVPGPAATQPISGRRVVPSRP